METVDTLTGKKPEFIVTIGASAGGLNAISEVVLQFTEDLDIAVFVVLHLAKVGMGNFLIHRLQKYSTFSCVIPQGGEKIEAGHIYIAPPDTHLLMKGDEIVLGHGPAENRWRPSIDVLFRSAAANYGNRVIGIILTGYLNDGTIGMLAIKKGGGVCIVQNPNHAEFPDMPLSVLESMEVDYCVSLKEMGETILRIIKEAEPKNTAVQQEVQLEAQMNEKVSITIDSLARLGERSLFSCPDCGGGLWEINENNKTRYRCHVGHAYSEKNLLVKQGESLEGTLWIALRIMEERRALLMKISSEETNKGLIKTSQSQKQDAYNIEAHIEELKELLFAIKKA